MQYAPILVSVYNRLHHFEKCIESLQKNALATRSDLYVVSDAAYRIEHIEMIEQIRSYVNSIKGFNEVHLIANEKNKGSVKSISDARDNILLKYDRYIFLEDDIEVSPYFLSYMNLCLGKYEKHENVFAVTGYNHLVNKPENYENDVYFLPVCPAWGIGYWKGKRQQFDEDVTYRFHDFIRENERFLKPFKKFAYTSYKLLLRNISGEIVSGDTRKTFYEFTKGMVTVIPVRTLTKCNGNDGSGEHSAYDYLKQVQVVDSEQREYKLPDEATIDPRYFKLWSRYFGNFQKKIRVLTRYYYYITKGRDIFIRDIKRKLGL